MLLLNDKNSPRRFFCDYNTTKAFLWLDLDIQPFWKIFSPANYTPTIHPNLQSSAVNVTLIFTVYFYRFFPQIKLSMIHILTFRLKPLLLSQDKFHKCA